MADDVLHSGVRGVTDLMVMPGLINLDFADIRTVMGEMGKAMMGTGEAEGDKRATDAAEAAISNPLLEDVSMKGARGVLINITGGLDMTLFEVDEAANRIREEVDPEANIIFGSTFDERLEGKMRISVVATGIDAEAVSHPRPAISLVSSRDTGPAVCGRRRPAVTRSLCSRKMRRTPPSSRPASNPRASPCRRRRKRQRARRCETVRSSRPSRPMPALDAPGGVDPAGHSPGAAKEPAPKPKGRVPSLIERVTGVGPRSCDLAAAAPGSAARQIRSRPGRCPTPAGASGTRRPAEFEQGRGPSRHPRLSAPASQLAVSLIAE